LKSRGDGACHRRSRGPERGGAAHDLAARNAAGSPLKLARAEHGEEHLDEIGRLPKG
jgi:hypothetical protein